jgi:hypothetical protein
MLSEPEFTHCLLVSPLLLSQPMLSSNPLRGTGLSQVRILRGSLRFWMRRETCWRKRHSQADRPSMRAAANDNSVVECASPASPPSIIPNTAIVWRPYPLPFRHPVAQPPMMYAAAPRNRQRHFPARLLDCQIGEGGARGFMAGYRGVMLPRAVALGLTICDQRPRASGRGCLRHRAG